MASLLHHHQQHYQSQNLLPKIPKKETNIWFPYDNPTESYAIPTTPLPAAVTAINQSLPSGYYSPKQLKHTYTADYKSPLLSPFATPPLPTLSHERKISSTTGVSSTAVSSSSSSCRYYPTIDKHDLFSSYANIVSESTSNRHLHHPQRPASAFPFTTAFDGASSTTSAGHYTQMIKHSSKSVSSSSTRKLATARSAFDFGQHDIHPATSSATAAASSSAANCFNNLFGSFSPVSPYPLLQNMSYDAAAAAVSSARCALPSPTIFPPKPPPSAPWAPWGGF